MALHTSIRPDRRDRRQGAAADQLCLGPGRENSVWSAFDAELQAVEKGMICIG